MTGFEDFALKRLDAGGCVNAARFAFHNDISDHNRARERTLSRSGARHLHSRMTVDHRLDLFGMDLQAADVNDTIPSADEIIAVTAQLDHVAGVDEAVRICERLARAPEVADRISRGADTQRAIFDLHFDAGTWLSDQTSRKASATIADLERYAGLRRSECMGDLGIRVESPKTVQDCLVSNLSR